MISVMASLTACYLHKHGQICFLIVPWGSITAFSSFPTRSVCNLNLTSWLCWFIFIGHLFIHTAMLFCLCIAIFLAWKQSLSSHNIPRIETIYSSKKTDPGLSQGLVFPWGSMAMGRGAGWPMVSQEPGHEADMGHGAGMDSLGGRIDEVKAENCNSSPRNWIGEVIGDSWIQKLGAWNPGQLSLISKGNRLAVREPRWHDSPGPRQTSVADLAWNSGARLSRFTFWPCPYSRMTYSKLFNLAMPQFPHL